MNMKYIAINSKEESRPIIACSTVDLLKILFDY